MLLILLLLGALGFGAYVMMKNSELQTDLSNEESTNESLAAENKKLKQTTDEATRTITDTLPNGKTITFPDTPENRDILWWSEGPDSGDTIVLSHKGYQEFLSTLSSDVITANCGDDSKPKATKYNIAAGTFDTANQTFEESGDLNCVAALAMPDNTDADSRDKALEVRDKISADVKNFVDSVKVQ